MSAKINYMSIIKTPIIIAIGVAIARIVLEVFNAPTALNIIVGVAWLHMLFPIYFALKIVENRYEEKPFITLMKMTALWALPVRIVVAISYVFGYIYQINSLRFQAESLGPVGEGITPLQGYLLLPLANFVSWMVIALVLGAIFGGITLKIKQRRTAQAA